MRRLAVLQTSLIVLLATVFSFLLIRQTSAQTNGLSLQVTPSPIVETLTPGSAKTVSLKIRNAGTETEQLQMGLQGFQADRNTSEITLEDNPPKGIEDWVIFENPRFSVKPGEWFMQDIRFQAPVDAGFSYSFAITISRQTTEQSEQPDSSRIEGKVAVFTLLNIDRPGATKALALTGIATTQRVYEYAPATIELTFQNDGNTLVQPSGNVFIGRSADDSQPISILDVNPNGSFILPESSRTFRISWDEAFPRYETTTNSATGEQQTSLIWDWDQADSFRIGRYTAKVVAIYDDGTRDIPLEATISFWIIPWKLLLGALFVLVLLVVGIVTILKKAYRFAQSKRRHVYRS